MVLSPVCLFVFITTPTRFRPHFQGPGPGQLHLPWSLSSHPCLPACPPRSSHQRVPVSTFLRSRGLLCPHPHLHPQCSFLRVRPLFLTLAYIALQDLLLSLPLPSLSLSPHGCVSNTQARSCFLAFAWTVPSPGTILKLDIEMARSLLRPTLCSNAAFPWGL